VQDSLPQNEKTGTICSC